MSVKILLSIEEDDWMEGNYETVKNDLVTLVSEVFNVEIALVLLKKPDKESA